MRLHVLFAVIVLMCCSALHAADKAPATATVAPACGNNSAGACQTSVLPVLMVTLPGNAPAQADPAPAATRFVPYRGILQESLLMRLIVILCTTMLPVALGLVTLLTVTEYRRMRAERDAY